jgi:hypothetical protein
MTPYYIIDRRAANTTSRLGEFTPDLSAGAKGDELNPTARRGDCEPPRALCDEP